MFQIQHVSGYFGNKENNHRYDCDNNNEIAKIDCFINFEHVRQIEKLQIQIHNFCDIKANIKVMIQNIETGCTIH